MVTFTHLQRGTDEERWRKAGGWSRVSRFDLAGVDRLVVVAAHPDDETLGAGGLIATAEDRGLEILVVVATDGEASHPDSPTHTPEALRESRRAEVREAVGLLAPSAQLVLLGLPDGRLDAHLSTLGEALERILVGMGGPGTLVAAPWRSDGHRDHEVAGAAAHTAVDRLGARLIEYPIWMWHWADPIADDVPWGRMIRLELAPGVRGIKRAAMKVHRSQTHRLSARVGDEALLSATFRHHFERPDEIYLEALDAEAPGGAVPGRTGSLPASFFDDFYALGDDPWGFETRWYEERKRALTLGALPRARFRSALELGCSVGMLTAALAGRCERVLGVDIAASPLRRARRRLAGQTHVDFAHAEAPGQWPEGTFDLIVLSEIGYYWTHDDLAAAIGRISASLTLDGVLLACHWRHPVAEHRLTGDDVHEALRRSESLVRTVLHLEEDFVLEVFTRPPGRSVARETGLIR